MERNLGIVLMIVAVLLILIQLLDDNIIRFMIGLLFGSGAGFFIFGEQHR